jgi:hypothetical protein
MIYITTAKIQNTPNTVTVTIIIFVNKFHKTNAGLWTHIKFEFFSSESVAKLPASFG